MTDLEDFRIFNTLLRTTNPRSNILNIGSSGRDEQEPDAGTAEFHPGNDDLEGATS